MNSFEIIKTVRLTEKGTRQGENFNQYTVVADRRGFNSIHVGKLPPQCAALNQISVAVEEMAVEAALTGDPTMVYHACAYDPLCAAVLSLAEIKKMVAEMLRKNQPHLPQLKRVGL